VTARGAHRICSTPLTSHGEQHILRAIHHQQIVRRRDMMGCTERHRTSCIQRSQTVLVRRGVRTAIPGQVMQPCPSQKLPQKCV
jgi:hypothetical protein